MLFGQNYLHIACPQRNFLYTISARDMLAYCVFAKQQATLKNPEVPMSADFDDLNAIDMVPVEINVHGTEQWQTKDFSTVKDLQEI